MLGHQHSASKLLSTFSSASSSCSSDHHNLRKRSCTGLFFQLFDWNSRLHKKQRSRRKSLPAGRPASPAVKDCHGRGSPEVLTAQTQNIIIDGCNPNDNLQKRVETPRQREQTSPENKRKKRSPNVVAKLMGLETMPSPDFRREKWPAHACHQQSPMCSQHCEGSSLLVHSRIPSSRRSLLEMEKKSVVSSSSRCGSMSTCLPEGQPSSTRFRDNVLFKNAECDVGVHEESGSAIPLAAPSIQDKKYGCILSPSNTHNKLNMPVKGPLAPKAKVCLFEAANPVLEPNRQPRPALNKSAHGNNENEHEGTSKKEPILKKSSSLSVPSLPYLQKGGSLSVSKPRIAGSYASSGLHAERDKQRASSGSAKVETTKVVSAAERLKRGHGTPEDMDSSKCYQQQQCSDHHNEKKVKLLVKRQEQSCRQPTQIASGKVHNAGPATTQRVVRHPYPPKIRGTTSEHQCESIGASSAMANSSVLTQNSTSSSTGAVLKNRGISSSCKTKTDKNNGMAANRDVPKSESSSKRDSVLRRVAGTTALQGFISKSRGGITQKTNLHYRPCLQKLSSAKDLIVEDNSSGDVNIECEDDTLTEALSCDRENLDDVVDSRILYDTDGSISKSSENTINHLNTVESASDSQVTENFCCGDSCVSLLDDMRDTASSSGINSLHKRKPTVSYSGKSTAIILQELLAALNPSARSSIVETNGENSEVSEIASMEEHIQEDYLHSLTSGCKKYIEEGSGLVSNREDLLLGVCKDNRHHISFETMDCTQEREAHYSLECEPNERREEVFHGLSMTGWRVMSKPTMHVFQSEKDYVKFIVDNAEFSPEDACSSSANKLFVDPTLFEDLERNTKHSWELKGMPENESEYWSCFDKEWYDNLARDHRKLVFDCVQEALDLDVGISVQPSLWNCIPNSAYSQSQVRCQRVLKHLNNWEGERCGMNIDQLVEKAMNTGSGRWDDFSGEIPGIAEQLEHTLVDSLIDELVLDLSSASCQKALDARSVKTMLERSEGKALIWVGL